MRHLRVLLALLAIMLFFVDTVRIAWKRNGYDDRRGFAEVEDTPPGITPNAESAR